MGRGGGGGEWRMGSWVYEDGEGDDGVEYGEEM